MIYLFYGEDTFSLRKQIDKLREETLPLEARDFNFARFDASNSSFNLDDLINAAESYPFLSEKRLVLVNDVLAKFGKSSDSESPKPTSRGGKKTVQPTATTPKERFLNFLGNMPETTVLVMAESKTGKSDAIFKAVEKLAKVIEFKPLEGMSLEKWISDHAKENKIKIHPAAVTLVAQYMGNDLWRIDNELQKLAAYAGENQTVTAEMVEKLSVSVTDTPIYKLTEALGQKNLNVALTQLNRMRSETTLARPSFTRYVFSSICKQVFELVQVRELDVQRRSPAEIATQFKIHPYRAEIILKLSRNFTPNRLDDLYNRLTELDYADKKGRADLSTQLDLLLCEFCAR
ncbi:MAG: DNA polymerase III subunit delta [Chloroflexi bacterium]|uniref:DNA polymerase III subunit delta n=1 Tax=Candidatus Chlorohelix allophototropha TaxID=3003348 RepID=A0A8T7M1Y3_9CHLR|nr:DNA polymerase III subunit delta [Chloroflexota bacterium]WJW67686.1 DNA polymerase III subunit delta [Chloroflexota bacterium L227-S17]